MKAQFFIRKASEWTPANKLQKALLALMPAFYNQLVDEPATFFERLTNRVTYLNRQFPRCTPLTVGYHPRGQYLRPGTKEPELRQQVEARQAAEQGWTVTISGLIELELQPVKGILSFDGPDRYAFTSGKPVLPTATPSVEQMQFFR